MAKTFTLEYWEDDGWFIGRLTEVPGVCSQAETLDELEENIRDAYALMLEGNIGIELDVEPRTKEIEVTA